MTKIKNRHLKTIILMVNFKFWLLKSSFSSQDRDFLLGQRDARVQPGWTYMDVGEQIVLEVHSINTDHAVEQKVNQIS